MQLLSKENISLVRTLGKKSGKKINKDSYLKKKKLINWKGYDVLSDVCALIELKKNNDEWCLYPCPNWPNPIKILCSVSPKEYVK